MHKLGLQERFEEAMKGFLLGRPAEEFVFSPEEWIQFSAVLGREGLLPFFYSGIKNRDAFPAEMVLEARQSYKNALLYKDYAVCRLKELQEQICEKGRVVLIKGLALCEYVYHEPEIRPMTDVDLYLPDGSIDEVRETLIDNGFECVESYPNLLRTKELVIDLHQDLWGVRRIAVRSELIPAVEDKFVASRMLPGYFFPAPLLMAAHSAYHCLKHGFSKKIWLMDLLRLYRMGCFEPGTMKSVGSTVIQVTLEHLFDQGLITDPVPEVRKIEPLRRSLLKQVQGRQNREGIGEILMALCCDTWWKTAVYFSATFIPRKEVLAEMYGKHLYPVLLLIRFFRMARYALGMLAWWKK